MRIRRLKFKEISEIIRLHKESIAPVWRRLKRHYNLKNIERYIKINFSKEKIFVLENEGRIIASGSIMFENFSGFKAANLGMMLVSTKEQGRGYGEKMVQFLENLARRKGIKEISLDVLIKNPAVKFYKHMGYKEYKLIMKKKI